jgi:hypothetical protein
LINLVRFQNRKSLSGATIVEPEVPCMARKRSQVFRMNDTWTSFS